MHGAGTLCPARFEPPGRKQIRSAAPPSSALAKDSFSSSAVELVPASRPRALGSCPKRSGDFVSISRAPNGASRREIAEGATSCGARERTGRADNGRDSFDAREKRHNPSCRRGSSSDAKPETTQSGSPELPHDTPQHQDDQPIMHDGSRERNGFRRHLDRIKPAVCDSRCAADCLTEPPDGRGTFPDRERHFDEYTRS